jgi:hypothetical protein
VAGLTSPGAAMAVMAVLSVAVTLILAPGLRPGRPAAPPDEPRDLPARDGSERARSAAAQ